MFGGKKCAPYVCYQYDYRVNESGSSRLTSALARDISVEERIFLTGTLQAGLAKPLILLEIFFKTQNEKKINKAPPELFSTINDFNHYQWLCRASMTWAICVKQVRINIVHVKLHAYTCNFTAVRFYFLDTSFFFFFFFFCFCFFFFFFFDKPC